jgi:hypothetical protein
VNIFHEFRAFVRLRSTKSASIHPFTALIAGVISTVAGECLKVEINFSLQQKFFYNFGCLIPAVFPAEGFLT